MNSYQIYATSLKRTLVSIEKIIAGTSLILLLAIILIQLVARNIFDYGFPLLDIISRHLVLFILFMGAALITEENNHIKVDILPSILPAQYKSKLLIPILILTSIICFIMSWFSSAFWIDEYYYAPENERMAVYFSLILPLGFIILAFHSLLLSVTGFDNKPIHLNEK